MQEVKIRLKMTQPILGSIRRPVASGDGVILVMPRDCQGRVMYLSSWWRERMLYAAKVLGKCYNDINLIAWATHIDGPTSEWRRYITRRKRRTGYALHEAFRPGVSIEVTAVIPASITIDDLSQLLTVVGTYKGISHYQSQSELFGTFEVVSVMPTIKQTQPASNARSPVT